MFAVVGALATVAAPAWSICTFVHRNATRLSVEVRFGFLTMTNGELLEGGRSSPSARSGATIPGEISPHHSGETYIRVDEVSPDADLDLTAPLTGWVALATGDKVRSTPTRCLTAS